MSDTHDDHGSAQLIGAILQTTAFADGLLDLTERLLAAVDGGVPPTPEDLAIMRANVQHWREQLNVFEQRLTELLIVPPNRVQ
jgi:hypothetical protein